MLDELLLLLRGPDAGPPDNSSPLSRPNERGRAKVPDEVYKADCVSSKELTQKHQWNLQDETRAARLVVKADDAILSKTR